MGPNGVGWVIGGPDRATSASRGRRVFGDDSPSSVRSRSCHARGSTVPGKPPVVTHSSTPSLCGRLGIGRPSPGDRDRAAVAHDIDVAAEQAGPEAGGQRGNQTEHAVERSCQGRRLSRLGLPATDGTVRRGPSGRVRRAHADWVDWRVETSAGSVATRTHADVREFPPATIIRHLASSLTVWLEFGE